jgi:hypothetical protein
LCAQPPAEGPTQPGECLSGRGSPPPPPDKRLRTLSPLARRTASLSSAAPALGDAVIAYSPLYGRANMSDSAWHDDTSAFQAYGPITAIEVYHSGDGWHDPYIGCGPSCARGHAGACGAMWGSVGQRRGGRGHIGPRRGARGPADNWSAGSHALPRAAPSRTPVVGTRRNWPGRAALQAAARPARDPARPRRPHAPLPCHLLAPPRKRYHPGGEFKGIRPTYGSVTNDQDLLFGARRPHKPFNFTLEEGEVRSPHRRALVDACRAQAPPRLSSGSGLARRLCCPSQEPEYSGKAAAAPPTRCLPTPTPTPAPRRKSSRSSCSTMT